MNLDQEEGYDPGNRIQAMTRLMETNGLLTGLIYQDTTKPSYEDQVAGFRQEGISRQNIQITEDEFERLVAEFK
ncbi:hypothetical protein D3C87_1963990 [compost metagenome]